MKLEKQLFAVALGLLLAACAPATSDSGEISQDAAATETATAVPALDTVAPSPTPSSNDQDVARPTGGPAVSREAESVLNDGQDSAPEASGEDGAKPVLIFWRTPALMGIGPAQFEWRFFADGSVTSKDGRSWQITPEELDSLLSEIEALGFFELASSYLPEDTCCDRAFYTVTAVGSDGRLHQVETIDEADAPAELSEIIELIQSVLLELTQP